MTENSAISWTDNTFNPWWGCSRVSPACRFCYADRDAKRYGHNVWRRNGERRMLSDDNWAKPLKWNRQAAKLGRPLRVFCASMADVFEDHPALPEPRARLWDLIERTPNLRWLLLTKRPENVAGMVPWGNAWPQTIWLGVSAENQRFANERIPILLKAGAPAAVRFVSAEPLLGPLDLHARDNGMHNWLPDFGPFYDDGSGEPVCQAHGISNCRQGCTFIDWVIAGGESGPKARPSHPAWFRSLRDQCETAGVAFHFKQWGEWGSDKPFGWYGEQPSRRAASRTFLPDGTDYNPYRPDMLLDPAMETVYRVGKKPAGRLLDGVLHDAFPLRPEAVAR